MNYLNTLLTGLIIILFTACSSSDDSNETNNDNENESQTPDGLLITTIDAFDIKAFTATSGGEIENESDIILIERGVVWSLSPSPNENDNIITDNTGLAEGTYTLNFDCLDINTVFYVRAYAKSSAEIFYGNEITFTTLPHNSFVGDAVLENQSDIDAFGANYYSRVEGDLQLNISDELDLSSINGLSEITGDLVISSNSPQNFSSNSLGLDCIKIIGGNLNINGNVSNYDGLSSLERIEGNFSVLNSSINASIGDLNSFSNLVFIGGSFIFRGGTTNTLSGLNNVLSLGQNLDNGLLGGIAIRSTAINNFDLFNSLNSNLGEIEIRDNIGVGTITGFNQISNVEVIRIANNVSNVLDIQGFQSLNTVNDFLFFDNNISQEFKGFNNLQTINLLASLSNNGSYIFNGLQNVTSIGLQSDPNAFVVLRILENFTALNGLSQVQNIGGNTQLYAPNISSINFSSLNTINGNLEINNIGTFNMNFLSSLSTVTGRFIVFDSPNLQSLDGLNNLVSVGESINGGTPLNISNNDNLSDFCALIPLFSTGFDNNGYGGVGSGNQYNPTVQQILNGECSQ